MIPLTRETSIVVRIGLSEVYFVSCHPTDKQGIYVIIGPPFRCFFFVLLEFSFVYANFFGWKVATGSLDGSRGFAKNMASIVADDGWKGLYGKKKKWLNFPPMPRATVFLARDPTFTTYR